MEHPTLGQLVHYQSYGTPQGEHPSTCRAAMVAETGQWITENTVTHPGPTRTLQQRWDPEACAVVVLNPAGTYFNTVAHDETRQTGGTWHWAHHHE
ncbi:hypothetical protein ACQEVF_57600 [Nonomuraea polychroma]|uniref:hypothetical protein n=1 Tax=Nonomuraea polychroma TaxID=46176 RepID=UPI003D8BA91E